MKFCGNCGAQMEDSCKFCPSCGAVTASAAPEPEVPVTPEPSAPPAPPEPPVAPEPPAAPLYTPHAAMPSGPSGPFYGAPGGSLGSRGGLLGEALRSPLFTVAVILFTLGMVLSMASMVQSISNVRAVVGLAFEVGVNLGPTLSIVTTISVLGMVISAVSVAGFWMVWSYGRNEDNRRAGSAGFTMLRVVCIIDLILLCIVGVVMVALFVLVMVAGSSGVFNEAMWDIYLSTGVDVSGIMGAGIIIALVLVLAILVFGIVYYAKCASTAKFCRLTVLTGAVEKLPSAFVGVVLFLGAALALLGAVGGGDKVDAMTLLVTLCGAAYNVCFGILIFQYRSKLQRQRLGY